MFVAIEDLENFRGAGNPFRSAECNEFLEFIVVAFRVEQTNLIFSLNQAFDNRSQSGGLAASGRTRDDQPRSVWLQMKFFPLFRSPQQYPMTLQARREARQVLRQ